MALVAYDDSDIENSDEESNVISESEILDIQVKDCIPSNVSYHNHDEPNILVGSLKLKEIKISNIRNLITLALGHSKVSSKQDEKTLFSSLPLPKTNTSIKILEEDDIYLQRKEKLPREQNSKPLRASVKISIPSLSKVSDVKPVREVEETGPKNNKTRLLSMLPEPKFGQSKPTTNNQKFVPRNVSLIKQVPSKPIKPQNSEAKPIKTDDPASDESDTEDPDRNKSDFFSLNSVLEVFVPENSIKMDTRNNVNMLNNPENYLEENITNSQQCYEEINYGNTVQASDEFQVQSSTQDQTDSQVPLPLDEEALIKLGGRRGRHRQEVQIIDIDQKEILPDSREWLLKALTEDNSKRTSASKRRGDEPTNQQKRKHQITYLAHQAKANEQELQNQWSSNRMSRKQTQSKYGF